MAVDELMLNSSEAGKGLDFESSLESWRTTTLLLNRFTLSIGKFKMEPIITVINLTEGFRCRFPKG